VKTANRALGGTNNGVGISTMIFPEYAFVSCKEQIASPRILPSAVVAARRVGYALIVLIMLLGAMLRTALAQTEVCGSSCSAWAAETNAGPAGHGDYFGAGLAWKGLSDNNIYFTTGSPGDWANQKQIGVAGSWYAKSNMAPALAVIWMM